MPFKVAKSTYNFRASERTIHLKESRTGITKTRLQFRFYSLNFQMINS